jgi:2-C-methyl-D-erythritol 2,4-cyclodiphosphate synthase
MLQVALSEVADAGYRVVNLDCIVFTQRPHLAAHKQEMRERIAQIMGLDIAAVAVKAKTGEGVGVVGREQAIAAQCVALLEKTQTLMQDT